MIELRADNVADWNPAWFEKADLSPDHDFYTQPRRVVHIDDGAIAAVTALYRQLLPTGGVILDLMSSWRSHLPPEINYSKVVGLGMNADEMADNPQLSEYVLHDLNQQPTLPLADRQFDAAICCVSVQYLQQPVTVLREVGRVLQPGAPLLLTFSNRCFPSKAINLWRYTSDTEHTHLVSIYLAAAGNWESIRARDCIPGAVEQGVDPLYAVWGLAR